MPKSVESHCDPKGSQRIPKNPEWDAMTWRSYISGTRRKTGHFGVIIRLVILVTGIVQSRSGNPGTGIVGAGIVGAGIVGSRVVGPGTGGCRAVGSSWDARIDTIIGAPVGTVTVRVGSVLGPHLVAGSLPVNGVLVTISSGEIGATSTSISVGVVVCAVDVIRPVQAKWFGGLGVGPTDGCCPCYHDGQCQTTPFLHAATGVHQDIFACWLATLEWQQTQGKTSAECWWYGEASPSVGRFRFLTRKTRNPKWGQVNGTCSAPFRPGGLLAFPNPRVNWLAARALIGQTAFRPHLDLEAMTGPTSSLSLSFFFSSFSLSLFIF